MLADELDYVVGVDTHLEEHVLAVVSAPAGAAVAGRSVRASARGYAAALHFADAVAKGRRVWAIEGAGHYGAGFARYLAAPGETVLEISRTSRAERRLQGKETRSTPLARPAWRLPVRRSPFRQRREALRLLLVARRSAVDVRREALGQPRGVIVTAPDQLREQLRGLPAGRVLERCRRLRRPSSARADELATRLVLRSLLDEPVGPIVAAQVIVAWSHRGRVRSEAAFARFAGVAPVPASSGQTRRHRLSRGGDRRLNRALHTIVLHRRQHDPATKDYIARRIAEGKSRRDATRLLKRYLARHLYRVLDQRTPLIA
jgi:transposase